MTRDGERGDTVLSRWLRPRWRAVVVLAVVVVGGIGTGAAVAGAFDDSGAPGASTTPTDVPITGVFRSVSVEQDGQPMALFAGVPPFWLAIERRSFGFYAGCNRTGGPLRVTATQIHVSEIGQTLIGCGPEPERRDEVLSAFLGRDPTWQLHGERLVLTQGPTTITLERNDLPPALPTPNPARPRDLRDARIGSGEFQTWPKGIGDMWRGGFVLVDVTARRGRTYLTMRARCRALEARVRIHRSTLTVGRPRTKRARCRSWGSDHFLDSVRPFFDGTVMWHLDRGRLTLQRDRATLKLRVR